MTFINPDNEKKMPAMRLALYRLIRVVVFLLLLSILNWAMASLLVWNNFDRIANSFKQSNWPVQQGKISAEIFRQKPGGENKYGARIELFIDHNRFRARINLGRQEFELGGGDATYIGNIKKNIQFSAQPTSFPECRKVLREIAMSLPTPIAGRRILISVYEHPWLMGWERREDRLYWRIKLRHGIVLVDSRGMLRSLNFNIPNKSLLWTVSLKNEKLPKDAFLPSLSPSSNCQVPADEIDRSVAENLRILQLQFQPVGREPDRFSREGKGWLRIRDGRRLLHLEGTAYEIGYQHGRLLAHNIRRLMNRMIYGVGLHYSLKKGKWFPDDASQLCKRQKRWVNPEYLEEMRGLAEGASLPVEDILRGNIFPEFFHCSGVALFGKATSGGKLFHARVLDYMTQVGLQDEAVVIAVHRSGSLRWVNIGYAGFIGSVTGMNEEQIAIGEIGGRGEGKWDGVPMSFLLRGALENATTSGEAVEYMRKRPRTCEYFYVISDGKKPDAVGVAATTDNFLVIRPGEPVDRLPEAIPDAVLISSGARYTTLVRRVRGNYGQIDGGKLIDIIKRPVAMRSNLHNVVFEPHELRFWVMNAGRNIPACDQPPTAYSWQELFP